MLRYDIPQRNKGCSVWIELSTFEELPERYQKKRLPTLAQLMAKSAGYELEVSYGVVTRTLPYTELLRAFPDVDPEQTYLTLHYKLDRPYQ